MYHLEVFKLQVNRYLLGQLTTPWYHLASGGIEVKPKTIPTYIVNFCYSILSFNSGNDFEKIQTPIL